MAERCVWCHGAAGTIEISLEAADRLGRPGAYALVRVHPEHEEALRSFSRTVLAHGRTFIWGILTILALVAAFAIGGMVADSTRLAATGTGVSLMLMSVLFIRWPFATPETVSALGVKRAVLVVRILAFGLFLLGVAIMTT